MFESFFLNLKPKTEFQLFIHFHVPLFLQELPFDEYEKENDDYHDFIKKYENFFTEDGKNINWSSNNSYFKEKIEILIDDLKKNNIDANIPFMTEAAPHIEKTAHSVIDKIKKNFIITNVNSIKLKSISTVSHFKDIHFSTKDFYIQKSTLEGTIEHLKKNLISQLHEKHPKRPLVNFFSSDLERINERLKPITNDNLPLLESSKIRKSFKREIIETFELTFHQKKLLSGYKEFLEKRQKILCDLMEKEDVQIKILFNELLDEMQKVETAWEDTLATSSDLESLLKLEAPLKNIISTLEHLKKMNNIQFTPPIEGTENSLENIGFILRNKHFFQLVSIKEQRIPLGLIGLFLNNLKMLANRLGHHLALFQLNQIGLILEKYDRPEKLILFENTTVNEALNNCSSHVGKATYHALKNSNIIQNLQIFINSIESTANNVFKSSQERKKFEEHYQYIQHATPPHLDLTDLNTKPRQSKNIGKKPSIPSKYFTSARTIEELKRQPSSAQEYIPPLFPSIPELIPSFFTSSTGKNIHKTSNSDSDDEKSIQRDSLNLNTHYSDYSSDYSSDEDNKEKKSELSQPAESKQAPLCAPRPFLFSPPPSVILNPGACETLFHTAQHFLETIIQSATHKKVELEESESHVPNALKFLNDLIEEQKSLLSALNKESNTFLQDVENLLEKDDIEKYVGVNKCLTRNLIVEKWLEDLIHSPAYQESRKTLILAVSTAEHRGRLVFSG